MRIPRIYTEHELSQGQSVELESQASHHLSKVLRMSTGSMLTVFNNRGGEYAATIVEISKKTVTIHLISHQPEDRQSPLKIHLGIALSKGDRLDWVMQKATELGVDEITPLITERTELKLKADREAKKMGHWQSIIIAACEQSLRNRLPQLNTPRTLQSWLQNTLADKKLVLHHRTEQQLNSAESVTSVALLIGPEGGLSPREIELAQQHDFSALSLGPRVLRTETAPLSALTLMQYTWGDM